jgi:hypothetical protein
MRLIIEHNHSRCPFKPHHLLYLRHDVSPDLMGTSLAETAMTSWHVPHWQARNLTQIQGLLIIPEHPTRREPIPFPEYLSRFSYIATKQLHGDWSKPDSDYNLLPQQLIPETSEDEPHTVSLNEDAVGSPLLSALRHPSIMKKLDAYAEYVRDCYTLVYERFNWAELAEAVLSNDGHYIMQFASLFNVFDEWLTGDTLLAIRMWETHELQWRLGYLDDIEERANPARSKADILCAEAASMHALWNNYLDCCIRDGNSSLPAGATPEFEGLEQIIDELKAAQSHPQGEVEDIVREIAGRVTWITPMLKEFEPYQDRTARVYRRIDPTDGGVSYSEDDPGRGFEPILVVGGGGE